MDNDIAMPTGILWDLDNTLYPANDAIYDAFNRAVARAAIEFGIPMTLDEAYTRAYQSFQKHRYSGLDFITDYKIPFADLHHKTDEYMDAAIVVRCGETCALFEEHPEMKHALITHAARRWAISILQTIGLDRWFPDGQVFAFENYDFESKARSRKPFEMALSSINRNPQDCIMVEDTVENLKVAHDMGITTVYLHHGAGNADLPDYVDHSFENTRAFLRALKQ